MVQRALEGQFLAISTYFSHLTKLTFQYFLKPHLNHCGQCWVTPASFIIIFGSKHSVQKEIPMLDASKLSLVVQARVFNLQIKVVIVLFGSKISGLVCPGCLIYKLKLLEVILFGSKISGSCVPRMFNLQNKVVTI